MSLLINSLLMITLTGCSLLSGRGQSIQIDSYPKEAEVSYFSSDDKQFKKIGSTPLNISRKEAESFKKSNEDYIVLKVAKSGHIIETLFIDLKSHQQIDYQANLAPLDQWNNVEKEVSSSAANNLAVKVQKINQRIATKDLKGALSEIEKLIEQFPKGHVFYDMKGSVLFLMGKRNESIVSYQQSLALHPDNSEAKNMLSKMKGDN